MFSWRFFNWRVDEDLTVNLKNNRFLLLVGLDGGYLAGGAFNNNNTGIVAGVCTKIEK